MDPRDMRLELLGPPRVATLTELGVEKLENYGQSLEEHPVDTGRMRRVIERVTELSRWNDRKKDGKIHVDLIPSEGPPGGIGEPGTPPVAPAIANAIFALTGQRIRELPLARAFEV